MGLNRHQAGKKQAELRTGAVPLIGEVAAVVVAVTQPRGQITQSGFLAALEGSALHSQAEETRAVGGFWP